MIDITKKYRTRDGREARVFMVDEGASAYPIIGAYKSSDFWIAGYWQKDGSASSASLDQRDLIEVKPRIQREVWINVYRDDVIAHTSRDDARVFGAGVVACVKVVIDCEEGEGL